MCVAGAVVLSWLTSRYGAAPAGGFFGAGALLLLAGLDLSVVYSPRLSDAGELGLDLGRLNARRLAESDRRRPGRLCRLLLVSVDGP
jgi:hypothetical protein